MAEINDFDPLDANNIARWPEGMAFAAVNDSARADEGILARFWRDVNGSLSTTGAANVYAIAANQTLTAYYTGLWLRAKANFTNTGAATMNFDTIGAKALVKGAATALEAGDIVSGEIYDFVYDGTNIQVLQLPASLAAALAGSAPLTLRRTENDTTEREFISLQLGSGAGNKGSIRAVGTGANDVTELRAYIAATEILRLTAALLKSQINFQVGAGIVLNAAGGFADVLEIAAPASPAADTARVYARDQGGTTLMAFKDSAGVETILGLAIADAAIMEAAASLLTAVPPGLQHRHPSAVKAWVKWNGNTSTIDAGYNVSSITDNGTGDFTINWTVPFSSANYGVSGLGGGAGGGQRIYVSQNPASAPTASAFRVIFFNDAGATVDGIWASVMACGDQ